MATQSTSKQLVTYGATIVGGTAIAATVGGIAKGVSAFSSATAANQANELAGAMFGTSAMTPAVNAGGAAIDAATSSFTSTMTSTFTNPAFLTSVGLGVAGILLGSGSKRPSLALPNILATAGVALSVGALLKQGQASLAAMEQNAIAKAGAGKLLGGSSIGIGAVSNPTAAVAKKRELGKQLSLSYPQDLGDRYFIKMSIYPYKRVKFDQTQTPGNPHTVIKLPLPTNLVDAIKLAYNDLSMGMFGGPMLDAMDSGYTAFQGAAGQSAGSRLGAGSRAMYDSMKSKLKDSNVLYAIGRRLLTNSTLGSAVDMIAGNTPNPHMAVTFQGVNLKKHTYNWRLAPTSESESADIRTIIRQLQAASLPGKDGFMLTFPDMVRVEISPPELMTYMPCFIDSVAVNYTPNGMPAFFASDPRGTPGGHPVEMELAITLREVEVHTNSDAFYTATRQGQQSVGGGVQTRPTTTQTGPTPPNP